VSEYDIEARETPRLSAYYELSGGFERLVGYLLQMTNPCVGCQSQLRFTVRYLCDGKPESWVWDWCRCGCLRAVDKDDCASSRLESGPYGVIDVIAYVPLVADEHVQNSMFEEDSEVKTDSLASSPEP
jgi:hypothetical protein